MPRSTSVSACPAPGSPGTPAANTPRPPRHRRRHQQFVDDRRLRRPAHRPIHRRARRPPEPVGRDHRRTRALGAPRPHHRRPVRAHHHPRRHHNTVDRLPRNSSNHHLISSPHSPVESSASTAPTVSPIRSPSERTVAIRIRWVIYFTFHASLGGTVRIGTCAVATAAAGQPHSRSAGDTCTC